MKGCLTYRHPFSVVIALSYTGYHAARKDIIVESEVTVIELQFTRTGLAERQLSEGIASDISELRIGWKKESKLWRYQFSLILNSWQR